ncbi:GtrA family protein [Paenibacillus sinopodophylli]|uniref:GtrA family protein n=1 Tax=Paenibacillus sinopodophylli TaxID=1837342 RepID=UPI001486FE94|nr:GtrA family protein [Paenibacillus sinopodophylli]
MLKKEVLRFVAMGLANTLITYGSYLAFLLLFSYNVSYLLSYVLGIVVSFILNSKIVFNTKMTTMKFIQYPLVYAAQFLLGFGLINVIVTLMGISEKIAPLIVTIVSLPITFVISKFILTDRLGSLLAKWKIEK